MASRRALRLALAAWPPRQRIGRHTCVARPVLGALQRQGHGTRSSSVLAASQELPPSMQRLALSADALQHVLHLAGREGPEVAYNDLVEQGALTFDESQHACARDLQQWWRALQAHASATASWREVHGRWQAEHARWRAAHAAWQATQQQEGDRGEPDGGNNIGSQPTPQGDSEPQEPPEPPAPQLEEHGRYIYGGVGAGKSLLMDLFVESCTTGSGIGRAVRRVHFHEFMHDVHRELHRLRQEGGDRTTTAVAEGIARDVQLLAFDEFQITNISDALIVESLFHTLFQAGVVTVMTSNRPPEDLYKDGLNRHLAIPQFLALLERQGVAMREISAARDFRSQVTVNEVDVSLLKGPWRDFVCKAGNQDGDKAQAFLDSAFVQACGAMDGGVQERIPIAWGRSLQVDACRGGVGRFSFSQLCGDALNADDYLRLTDRFHTLIVADVPQFTLEQHNEARRFTNLVDCAYERHARLVLSADVPPDRLLESMETLASFSAKDSEAPDFLDASIRKAADDWVRYNPFGPDPHSVTEAARRAAAGPNDAAPGDDDSKTGSGVAGVMAGAVGSLQESGFAARRATSRLLHMQTDDYLAAHRRHRLGEPP